MTLKNTTQTYGVISKFFHWAMVILILSLLAIGLVMEEMPKIPLKVEVYALHKSFGLLVLWMVGLRIVWHVLSNPPQSLPTHTLREKILSKATHIFLYMAMIGLPLSGWVMSSAGQHPVSFFGLMMPNIVSPDKNFAETASETHEILANLLIAAIALHFIGAIKHHVIDKDDTLVRMSASGFKRVILAGLVLFSIAVMVGGVLKINSADNRALYIKVFAEEYDDEDDEKDQAAINTGQVDISIDPDSWVIDKAQSALSFFVQVYNMPVEGRFGSFDGTIIFDPQDVSKTKIDITIDMKIVETGDAQRDAEILGAEWFNVADYPTAHFVSQKVEEGVDAQNFVMVGDLTMVGKTMPLILPFTLDIIPQGALSRAYVKASTALNRTDFGLGGKLWETEDYVSHNTNVRLQLVAEKPLITAQ